MTEAERDEHLAQSIDRWRSTPEEERNRKRAMAAGGLRNAAGEVLEVVLPGGYTAAELDSGTCLDWTE